MSITVADVMKLPSMRGAKVLGGAGGLTRVVSSISVLEYARPTAIQSELFDRIEFLGNELAITGFMNDPDDVELQCTNLRRLAGIGEVGVILFYVGIVMKKVDRRLIDVANELSFPLICMPVGQMNQRYSEVICEVMELIYRDQMASTNLVSELLEQAVGLAPHQRTVDSMLRLLADRLHASVVLMDRSRRVLNEAAWPRSLDQAVKERLSAAEFPASGSWGWCEELNIHIYRDSIQTWEHHAMDLLIFKEGDILDVVLIRQAVEVVQLTVSIWSDKHDRIVIGELVRAILQDEPMKMRRLADIFHVDVASINSMWIISGDTAEDREKLPDILEAVLRDTRAYSETAIADIYEGEMVLFMIGPGNMQDVRALTEAVGNGLAARHIRRYADALPRAEHDHAGARGIFEPSGGAVRCETDFSRTVGVYAGADRFRAGMSGADRPRRTRDGGSAALRCRSSSRRRLSPGNAGTLPSGRADACDADGGDDVSAQKHHQIPSPAHCGTPGLCSR